MKFKFAVKWFSAFGLLSMLATSVACVEIPSTVNSVVYTATIKKDGQLVRGGHAYFTIKWMSRGTLNETSVDTEIDAAGKAIFQQTLAFVTEDAFSIESIGVNVVGPGGDDLGSAGEEKGTQSFDDKAFTMLASGEFNLIDLPLEQQQSSDNQQALNKLRQMSRRLDMVATRAISDRHSNPRVESAAPQAPASASQAAGIAI